MNAPALIEPTLDQLATEINAAHAAAQALSSQAVERAHDAGIWLNQAKAQVEHGQWLPWLAEHCPAVAVRTAQAYMRLAQDWPKLESEIRNGVAHLNFRQAIKLLSAQKPANLTKKRLPKPPAKYATPVADLPKPEPPRPASKPGAFEAALAKLTTQFDAAIGEPSNPEPALDLSFPPKKPLTPEQEYLAFSDAARRKAEGLPDPEPDPESDPESLGFVGIAAMQQLDGRFNELLDLALSGPKNLSFQQVLRPIEEIRDFMPKYLKTIEQARATVEFLEILTQQARLRLAWLESHPEPLRPAITAQSFNFGDLAL